MGNEARDSNGRFCGAYRLNVEDVPRLPIFPARWALEDPRGRPYFVFWTSSRGVLSPRGALSLALRVERVDEGNAVRISDADDQAVRIPIIRRPLPTGGGTTILYRCPGCWRPRRYLYPMSLVGGVLVSYLGPHCRACLGLRWASQGCYRRAFVRRLWAAWYGRAVRDPHPRHPWDPRAVSHPRLVMDEFPSDLRDAGSPGGQNGSSTGR